MKAARLSRRFSRLFISGLIGLLIAGTQLREGWHAAHDLQIEIEVVSPVPFQEDIPRVAHLLVPRQGNRYERIEARCYASAFFDRRTTFRFRLANDGTSEFLFSPAQGDTLVAIRSVRVRVGNEKEAATVALDSIAAVQQVEIVDRRPDRILVKTSGRDRAPLVGFRVGSLPQVRDEGAVLWRLWVEAVIVFFGVGAVLFVVMTMRPVLQKLSLWAVLPFVTVAALIVSMAVLSRFNAHPDEYLHFETARYFMSHLLPPALDDPATGPSFSHYGVSYLQDLDVSYFLMGKFMAAFDWLRSPEIAARLFNVLLFLGLAAYALLRLRGSLAAAVLLISPQVWYVFSYVNGDAWALAIALIAVVQLGADDSYLNQYLRANDWRTKAGGGLAFAALLGLLLMAKRNYYLFLPFIGLVAVWKGIVWERSLPRLRLAGKWAAIVLTALTLYFPARVAQLAVNRFELPRLRAEQAEKFAAPGFRPSEIAAGHGAARMALREQGVPLTDLFGKYRWASTSFQSFCGVYGWMKWRSPQLYFALMAVLYVGLLATVGFAFRKLAWSEAVFGAAVLCLAGAIILLSAYHSWTTDFQPQGRYLFPVLPMLAFVLYRYRETLPSRALHLLFSGLFAASVFSFVFIGLRAIPQ